MKPWLSVVIPTFRGERFVGEALASVRDGADPGVECLVVDDGSDDGTLDIVRTFANDLDLRVIQGGRRANWAASTNIGLREARAPLACFLHQDDGWDPNRTRAIREAFARHPSARLVFHATRLVDASGAPLLTWHASVPRADAPMASSELVERLLVQNFIAIPSPVFRTADALACGGLDESLWYTADWDLWLTLAELGPSVYLEAPLAWFRVHGDSQTIRRSGDPDSFRRQMTSVLEKHITKGAVPTDRRVEVAAAARLSIEANVLLATLAHRGAPDVGAIVRALGSARPRSLWRFARDSKLGERLGARALAASRGRLRA